VIVKNHFTHRERHYLRKLCVLCHGFSISCPEKPIADHRCSLLMCRNDEQIDLKLAESNGVLFNDFCKPVKKILTFSMM